MLSVVLSVSKTFTGVDLNAMLEMLIDEAVAAAAILQRRATVMKVTKNFDILFLLILRIQL